MRTPEEQIRYAASITPSPRQLAWQQLEFYAFTHFGINAIILGGSYDIDRKNIDKLINLRSYYKITGKHPGYRKFERREKGEPTDK